jgi:transcriptional regulator with XRE-family HTH domain
MYLDKMTYYIRVDKDTDRLLWDASKGQIMQKLREKRGFTRQQMADSLTKAGVSQVRRLEIDKGRNAAETIETGLFLEICQLLDEDPSFFGYSVLAQPLR